MLEKYKMAAVVVSSYTFQVTLNTIETSAVWWLAVVLLLCHWKHHNFMPPLLGLQWSPTKMDENEEDELDVREGENNLFKKLKK